MSKEISASEEYIETIAPEKSAAAGDSFLTMNLNSLLVSAVPPAEECRDCPVIRSFDDFWSICCMLLSISESKLPTDTEWTVSCGTFLPLSQVRMLYTAPSDLESTLTRFWEHSAGKESALSECARCLTMSERLLVDCMLIQLTSWLRIVTDKRDSQIKPGVLMAFSAAVCAACSRTSFLSMQTLSESARRPAILISTRMPIALPSLFVCE